MQPPPRVLRRAVAPDAKGTACVSGAPGAKDDKKGAALLEEHPASVLELLFERADHPDLVCGVAPSDLRAEWIASGLEPAPPERERLGGDVMAVVDRRTWGWVKLTETNEVCRRLAVKNPELHLVDEMEVAGAGDCGFACLAAGINERFYGDGKYAVADFGGGLTMQHMRLAAAESLSATYFADFLKFSRQALTLPAGFDSQPPERQLELTRAAIRRPGAFWMTDHTLALLTVHSKLFRTLKLGFAVVSTEMREFFKREGKVRESLGKRPVLLIELHRLPETKHLMFLRNLGDWHWRLLGIAPRTDTLERFTCWPVASFPRALYPFARNLVEM